VEISVLSEREEEESESESAIFEFGCRGRKIQQAHVKVKVLKFVAPRAS